LTADYFFFAAFFFAFFFLAAIVRLLERRFPSSLPIPRWIGGCCGDLTTSAFLTVFR
jgi:hypothetical protein